MFRGQSSCPFNRVRLYYALGYFFCYLGVLFSLFIVWRRRMGFEFVCGSEELMLLIDASI